MITNRDEVLDNAFRVFVRMNYEKASFTEIAKACGLSRAGIIYYFPYKQDLFMAVADKFVFRAQQPENKFDLTAGTLAEFIEQYIQGVTTTMKRIKLLVDEDHTPNDCSLNFYYYNFFAQVRMYYPNAQQKIARLYEQEFRLWADVIQRAKDSGELRPDTDVRKSAVLFRQTFMGMGYEHSFLNGLDITQLTETFHYIYSLLKA